MIKRLGVARFSGRRLVLRSEYLGLVNKLSSIFGWLRRAVAKAALARRRLRLAVSALSSLEPKRNSPAGGQGLISLPVLSPRKANRMLLCEVARYVAREPKIKKHSLIGRTQLNQWQMGNIGFAVS